MTAHDGARFSLRALDTSHTEIVHVYTVENRSFLQPWEPIREESDFSVDGVREQLLKAEENRASDRSFAFGVFAESVLVGRINVSNVVRGAAQSCTLGYSIGERYNGKGFATVAVSLAVRFAFEQAGLHRVQAAILPRNAASVRVVEKNGFRDEGVGIRYLKIAGVWEDHRIFALTVEDVIGRDFRS